VDCVHVAQAKIQRIVVNTVQNIQFLLNIHILILEKCNNDKEYNNNNII
jgi:hypothetical protein